MRSPINVQRDRGSHALVQATLSGDKKTVEMLLNAGADIHAKQHLWGTALDVAARHGDREMVEMLPARDTNLEARGQCYGQALLEAIEMSHEHLVEISLDYGADINAQFPSGDSALVMASYERHIRTVDTPS